MKKFLITISVTILTPMLFLLGIYIWTDPFRTLKPFSLHYFDSTNRDYLSSELYLMNNPKYHYNSFIFGSSRAGGLNSYKWKQYLPAYSHQFVFQAWSETITGIYQKMKYIDEHGDSIKNAFILLDIPSSFADPQEPSEVLSIKHFKFSGQPYFIYQSKLFFGFIKPSFIIQSIRNRNIDPFNSISFDTISNDWEADNRYNYTECPPKDSLRKCTSRTIETFLKEASRSDTTKISKPVIDDNKIAILKRIKSILDKQQTNYIVVVSPGYYLTQPAINPADLEKLQNVFGYNNVFNYSGDNYLTRDYNNFSDPTHFGLYVGWQMMEEIYSNSTPMATNDSIVLQ